MRIPPPVVLLLCACVASCGGDDGATDSAGTASATTGASTTDATSSGSSGGSSSTTGDTSGSSGGATDGSGGSSGGGAPAHVFFINFDGVELAGGPDDATMDTTSLMPGVYDPFPGDRAPVLSRLQSHWAPFNVEITDTRPAEGPYNMAVVSPTNPYGAGVSAIGPLDCNNLNPSNVVWALGEDNADPDAVAVSISSRLGSSFGVVNSAFNKDLSGTSANTTATWNDECLLVDTPPSGCAEQALAHCDTADEQNSARILLDQLGLAP